MLFAGGRLILQANDVTWLAFLAAVIVVLVLAYVVFMKKYYHLHEEYLASLKK